MKKQNGVRLKKMGKNITCFSLFSLLKDIFLTFFGQIEVNCHRSYVNEQNTTRFFEIRLADSEINCPQL